MPHLTLADLGAYLRLPSGLSLVLLISAIASLRGTAAVPDALCWELIYNSCLLITIIRNFALFIIVLSVAILL